MALLQIATVYFITKCHGQLLTNCDSFFITKCDTVYYKLRQVLQSAMDLLQIGTGITKCDDYYKLQHYTPSLVAVVLKFDPETVCLVCNMMTKIYQPSCFNL